MSMISTAPVAAQGIPGRSWGTDLGAALARRWVAYTAWRMERRAMTELVGMSDRELKDIGLTRTDIPAVIRGEFIRERAMARGF